MKPPPIVRLLAAFMAFAALARSDAAPMDELFRTGQLLQIEVTVPAGSGPALGEHPRAGREKPSVRARVREGGRTYADVAVQLKGNSTFEPLDQHPSLTLNFSAHVPDQTFYGLHKVSLNNSAQDPSKLHEKFARELFNAAGVPTPRATHALVTLNGRPLGLYVLLEGYGQTFLRRHFPGPAGKFYEGGTLCDIDHGLQFKSGPSPDDHTALDRLLRAADEPDPDRRWAALAAVLDTDRFLSSMAVEAILCHSDSYSMNRNNYRLWLDPGTRHFVFLPHGMDRILGTHRSGFDLPVVPPAMGRIARAVLTTPEGRRRYVDRAGTLFTNLFDPDRLCERIRAIDAQIVDARIRHPGDRLRWGGSDREPADDAEDLCRRLRRRITHVRQQFAQPENLLALTPEVRFDGTGAATPAPWRLRLAANQPPAELSVTNQDGRERLRVRTSADHLRATLWCRLLVPAGNYRLTGAVSVVNPAASGARLTMVRYHSTDRFTTERRRLGSGPLDHALRTCDSLPAEEIEIEAEVDVAGSEAWLDPGELRLVRAEPSPRRRRPLIGR